MQTNTKDTATQFVNLALKHTRWNEITTLPEDDMKIFFDTVSAAGFDPKQIAPGQLTRNCRDEKGNFTDKTYPINGFCRFKVIDQDSNCDYSATGWLDCALRRVALGIRRKKEVREDFIGVMIKAIEESIPLKPIQLTREGDFLIELPPKKSLLALEYFVRHTRDSDPFDSYVGIHRNCGGSLRRVQATRGQDKIECLGCALSLLFPKEIQTYDGIRRKLTFQQMRIPA